MVDLAQNQVIEVLNQYLAWHRLPFTLNKTGICNGLAAVYTKYALSGKRDEFFDMLKLIVSTNPRAELHSQINAFVSELMLGFLPQRFDKSLNQPNAVKTLTVNGKQLNPAWRIAAATDDANWAGIIKQLNLRSKEVLMIGSINHTVAVEKLPSGSYSLYDPNYPNGSKLFANEAALIDELHHQVFAYQPGALGMEVSIIPNPDNPKRDLPNPVTLLQQFLPKDQLNQAASITKTDQYNTLQFCARTANADVIDYLLKNGAKTNPPYQALAIAIMQNNTEAIPTLLDHFSTQLTDIKKQKFLLLALEEGRQSAFNQLLQDRSFCEVFNHQCLQEPHVGQILGAALRGGDPELFDQVFQAFCEKSKLSTTKPNFLPQALSTCGMPLLLTAVQSLNTSCLERLYNHMKKLSISITPEQNLQLLIHAIRLNHPRMVSFLADKVPTEAVQALQLSTRTLEKTDLAILNTLKDHGMPFNNIATAILQQKENQGISLTLKIGIALRKFTEFIKEHVLKETNHISYDKTRVQALREELHAARAENPTSVDTPEPEPLENLFAQEPSSHQPKN